MTGACLKTRKRCKNIFVDMNELYSKVELYVDDKLATYTDVKRYLDGAIALGMRAASVPQSYVLWSKKYVCKKIKIGTFVGVPNGNDTVFAKAHCIREGLKNGAEEFAVAINYNELKSGNADYTACELKRLKRECRSKLFKCILQTELLSDAETENFCAFALQARCDYVCLGYPKNAEGENLAEKIAKIKAVVGKKIKLAVFCADATEESVSALLSSGIDRVAVKSVDGVFVG